MSRSTNFRNCIGRKWPDRSYIQSTTPTSRTTSRRAEKALDGAPGSAPMFKSKEFREKAAESAESLKRADDPGEIRKFQRLKESFNSLAENEDWLADNFDKIIRSNDVQDDDTGAPITAATAAKVEEHILRCLGAAVIL